MTFCPGMFSMHRLCHSLGLSLALFFVCCCADAAKAQSFGRWNLPSTTAQVFGYGNGAGHHAPMVRTLGCKPERVPRVAFVPCKRRVGCSTCNSTCKQPNFVPLPTAVAGCTGGHCGVQTASQPWQQQWQQPLPQYPQAQYPQAVPTVANPQPFFLPPPTPPQPKQNLAKVSVPAPPMPTAKPASASE